MVITFVKFLRNSKQRKAYIYQYFSSYTKLFSVWHDFIYKVEKFTCNCLVCGKW